MVKKQVNSQARLFAVQKEIKELTHKIKRVKNPQVRQDLQNKLELKESIREEILANI